jgi:hypothetical protein
MKGEKMKRAIIALVLLFALYAGSEAQTPQYYNANSGGIGNTIPFGSTAISGYKSQYLIGPNEYLLPTPAPAGSITKLYIYMSSTGGPATFTNLKIRMGQAAITTFPAGEYTGTMDSLYYRSSVSLSSTANAWMMITLDNPFTYNPAQSLIIEISHCGYSGSGMSVWQTAGTTGIIRRNNIPGTTSCIFTYSGQDTRILQCGVDIAPLALVTVNRCIVLPSPGINTNYVQIPYNAGMVGWGNNITIEGWVKLGSATTPNTVLNKGAASFDYQLGINSSTTGVPFFRAGSTILAGTVPVPVGIWTHVAVTFNGSSAIFYINGVAGSPVSGAATLGSSSGEMRIGRGNNDPGTGKIEEVRLWSVVRTAAEISTNMCNKWIPNNATGLKAKWHFDSTLVDSVNGWNGTIMGSITYDTAVHCIVTGIPSVQQEAVREYRLSQNYPNPFNPLTKISYDIPKPGFVTVKIYDMLGKEIAVLVNETKSQGRYIVEFDGSSFSSGTYFYRLESNGYIATKKMLLIK